MKFGTLGIGSVVLAMLASCEAFKDWSPPASFNPAAEPIEQILAWDLHFSRESGQAISSGVSRPEAVASLVQQMRSIDTSQCPADFREGYQRHIHAWDAFSRWLYQNSDPVAGLVEAMLRVMSGEVDGGASRLMDEDRRIADDIRLTWNEVEALAVRYGARLPN